MNKQQQIDIIRSILDHPQWEATYLHELVDAVMKQDKINDSSNVMLRIIGGGDMLDIRRDGYDAIHEWIVEIDSMNKTIKVIDSC